MQVILNLPDRWASGLIGLSGCGDANCHIRKSQFAQHTNGGCVCVKRFENVFRCDQETAKSLMWTYHYIFRAIEQTTAAVPVEPMLPNPAFYFKTIEQRGTGLDPTTFTFIGPGGIEMEMSWKQLQTIFDPRVYYAMEESLSGAQEPFVPSQTDLRHLLENVKISSNLLLAQEDDQEGFHELMIAKRAAESIQRHLDWFLQDREGVMGADSIDMDPKVQQIRSSFRQKRFALGASEVHTVATAKSGIRRRLQEEQDAEAKANEERANKSLDKQALLKRADRERRDNLLNASTLFHMERRGAHFEEVHQQHREEAAAKTLEILGITPEWIKDWNPNDGVPAVADNRTRVMLQYANTQLRRDKLEIVIGSFRTFGNGALDSDMSALIHTKAKEAKQLYFDYQFALGWIE